MGKETNIAWTDSTWSPWHGCQKVGPACDHCYAEAVNKRGGGSNWGPGALRRPVSDHTLNEPGRWNTPRNADKFLAEHGRLRRVFCGSMCDIFDNAVDQGMTDQAMRIIEETKNLEWQLLTKRVGNVVRRIPDWWGVESGRWPQHVGLMVTVVTQEEADRDLPKLRGLKHNLGIPWVGVSYEPAQEFIDFSQFLHTGPDRAGLDWIIFGGKSGPKWNDRPFDIGWGYSVADMCEFTDTAFFMKQVAALRPTDDMIPKDLMIRQWPRL